MNTEQKAKNGMIGKIMKVTKALNLGFYKKSVQVVYVHKSMINQAKTEIKTEIKEVTQQAKNEQTKTINEQIEQVEKEFQNSVSLFIADSELSKNKKAIQLKANLAKVGIEFYQTEKMAKKHDTGIKAKKGQDTDSFNEFMQIQKNYMESKGVRYIPFMRKFNKNGKSIPL